MSVGDDGRAGEHLHETVEPCGTTTRESPPDLVESVRTLLDSDDYLYATRWLRTDPRLLTDTATTVLDGASLSDHEPEARAQLRAYLRRCASGDLDVVAPTEATEVDPPVLASVRDELDEAGSAQRRFADTGDVTAMDTAVRAWRAVLDAPSLRSAYPGLVAALTNDAAGCSLRRFWARGDPDDLETAPTLFGTAVVLSPPRSAKRAHRLANHAVVSREIYLRVGATASLDLAVRSLRSAVTALAGADGARPDVVTDVLTNLALVLRDRHLIGDPDALDEAIEVAERAANSDSLGARVMLADLLGPRAQRDGSTADLERAVALLTEVVDATPTNNAERPRRAVDLAIALTERFSALGDPDNLDRAVGLCAEATELLPTDSPDAPHAWAQLAVASYRRFESAGHLDDLDRAVEILDRIVRESPSGEIAAAGWRTNLATALIQRARRTNRPADLDRAVEIVRAAVDVEGPDRYVVLNNLGNALRDRARLRPNREDLDEAASHLRDALAATGPGTARRCTTMTNLAIALRDRYRLAGTGADLDEAVGLAEAAVESGVDSDVDQPRRYFTYALVAQDCAGLGVERARAAADHAYRSGCAAGAEIDPESTLVAAQDWAAWATAEGRWLVAAEAFEIAMTAVSSLVATQVGRTHQETWLRAAVGTAASAAYAARADGRPSAAVVALERGRAALFSEAVGTLRDEIGALAHDHPDVALRYRAAVGALRLRRSGVG